LLNIASSVISPKYIGSKKLYGVFIIYNNILPHKVFSSFFRLTRKSSLPVAMFGKLL